MIYCQAVILDFLYAPNFAEECIKQIADVFYDNYEVALAIYNKEAGLKDAPYIPPKPLSSH